MKRLVIAAVGLALMLALAALHEPSARAQPLPSIDLPSPRGTVQLYPGCNNIMLTFADGTASETVVGAVTPAGMVESMWRHDAASGRFEGFNPDFPEVSDLRTVDLWDAVWICVGGAFKTPPAATPPPSAAGAPRPLPDTTDGIHVFNDQLSNLSPGLVAFSAAHYDGTQKMTRADADALRAVNPNFVILHYRLGLGLGYRTADADCVPNGQWLQIIDGDWTQEWPGDDMVQDSWFYEVGGRRVLHCGWGWYLMQVDDPGYRTWWLDAVMSQMANNDADGLFADSVSVPNFLGGDQYDPALPALDAAFEAEWTTRINSLFDYIQGRFAGRYYLIPNAGDWVTGRDAVDYGRADGVMIEGFGFNTWEAYGEADWALQMDRALGLIGQGDAVIAQSYRVDSPGERLFTLGSYLLIKGDRTYVNLDFGEDPEWWPEYDIPIGSPQGATPANVAALFDAGQGVYSRSYSNGLVLVNAGDASRTVDLGGTYHLAQSHGGGTVPPDGALPPAWNVTYDAVSQVTLEPGQAAILVLTPPGS